MSIVTSIVHLKDIRSGLEHKLKLAETSMHARSTNSRITQLKLKDQISAITQSIEALTAALHVQVDAAKSQIHIGSYIVTRISPDKVSIFDTRTGEGGAFSADAFGHCITDALDTFFSEEF